MPSMSPSCPRTSSLAAVSVESVLKLKNEPTGLFKKRIFYILFCCTNVCFVCCHNRPNETIVIPLVVYALFVVE